MLARLLLSISVLMPLLLAPHMLRAGEAGAITVYKNANCGCCGKWAQHLRDNGFSVDEKPMRSMAGVKQAYGITPKLKSCHTAILGASDAHSSELQLPNTNRKASADSLDGASDAHKASAPDTPEGSKNRIYVIEGHVPAKDIKRLLSEKPDVKGLAVPGMPIGSPGMEAPDGRTEKYDVLSFDDEGKTEVFASH